MTKRSFNLRPFQQRVFDTVMRGESVILQAPTGSGKTRAALAPFLQNLAREGEKLPLTCRYAVPMRVLASQFYKEYESYGQKIDSAMDTRLCTTYGRFNQKPVSIQTGEQPDDPQFESALTFCTIDQLLASFLAIPYSLGKRRANMNVGGIIGSYMVLDEFHLYPVTRGSRGHWGARTSALQMLSMLKVNRLRLTPFVLMTATFSSHLLSELKTMLDAEIIDVLPGEYAELNAERIRIFSVHDQPMDAQTILDQHTDCSLVVCNTVLRAQKIFLELRRQILFKEDDTQLVLLHSRFTDQDRADRQVLLENAMGEDKWKDGKYLGPNIIVIATQVVEVGLNISVRTLHSEAAPANSIIQRAGRCARFARQHGHVHIYPIPLTDRGRPVFLPYTERETLATLQAFTHYEGQHVGFPEEQAVIDAVHSGEDAALLQEFKRDRSLIHDKMYEGFSANKTSIAPSLIRDVQQVTLLIHDDPNAAINERPWEWQTFSLHPGTLESRWDVLQEVATTTQAWGDEHPMSWQAKLDLTIGQEQNERRPTQYLWEPFTNSAQIRSALIISLSPTVVTYDSDLGLLLRDGRLEYTWPSSPFRSKLVASRKKQWNNYNYLQESYAEHIGGLFNAYRQSRLQSETRYVRQRLQEALGLQPDAIDHAIRLAIACHDIGKLGIGWQHWMQDWQALLVRTYPHQAEKYQARKFPFAHSDSEGREHRDLQRNGMPKRPNHACESAYLAAPLIEASLSNQILTRATIAAIARHHGPESQHYDKIKLIHDARRYVQEMLDLVVNAQPWTYEVECLDLEIDDADSLNGYEMTLPRREVEAEIWLYFLIVRVLRLSDNRSFEYRKQ